MAHAYCTTTPSALTTRLSRRATSLGRPRGCWMMLTVSSTAMCSCSRSSAIEPRKSSPRTPQKVKSSSALVTNSESGSSGADGRPARRVARRARPRSWPARRPTPAVGGSGRTWWLVSRTSARPGTRARGAVVALELHARPGRAGRRPEEVERQEVAAVEDQLQVGRAVGATGAPGPGRGEAEWQPDGARRFGPSSRVRCGVEATSRCGVGRCRTRTPAGTASETSSPGDNDRGRLRRPLEAFCGYHRVDAWNPPPIPPRVRPRPGSAA